jgi:hypothetical protein
MKNLETKWSFGSVKTVTHVQHKIADSVWSCMFIRDNLICNNSHSGLNCIQFSTLTCWNQTIRLWYLIFMLRMRYLLWNRIVVISHTCRIFRYLFGDLITSAKHGTSIGHITTFQFYYRHSIRYLDSFLTWKNPKSMVGFVNYLHNSATYASCKIIYIVYIILQGASVTACVAS